MNSAEHAHFCSPSPLPMLSAVVYHCCCRAGSGWVSLAGKTESKAWSINCRMERPQKPQGEDSRPQKNREAKESSLGHFDHAVSLVFYIGIFIIHRLLSSWLVLGHLNTRHCSGKMPVPDNYCKWSCLGLLSLLHLHCLTAAACKPRFILS